MGQLDAAISKLSVDVSRLRDTVKWSTVDDNTRRMLKKLSPNCKYYLADKFFKGAIFKSCVYRVLVDHIFDISPKEKYQAPLWQEYGILLDALSPGDTYYNDSSTIRLHLWRFLTATMLNRLDSEGAFNRQPMVAKPIKQTLSPFFKNMDKEIDDQIEEIVRAALLLDLRFQIDKGYHSVDFMHFTEWRFGEVSWTDFTYEEESGMMKLADEWYDSEGRINGGAPKSGTVDLIVTPLLRRRGDRKGFNYQRTDVIEPMQVILVETLHEQGILHQHNLRRRPASWG